MTCSFYVDKKKNFLKKRAATRGSLWKWQKRAVVLFLSICLILKRKKNRGENSSVREDHQSVSKQGPSIEMESMIQAIPYGPTKGPVKERKNRNKNK